ncbi:MAG: helix-turn-helix domain-containing protein [Acidimicrobiia bacterium]|nr:helix-turn-helix domain-containing protein [Acidimicrobiia bacterium]
MVVQASALVSAADGVANEAIARECGTSPDTVRRWRRKFEEGGPEAAGSIASGRGAKNFPQETVDPIGHDTLHTIPDEESTSWSTRTMGERNGVGKDTVARIWRARKLRPWRVESFKLSKG